jgi:hypothetical protein
MGVVKYRSARAVAASRASRAASRSDATGVHSLMLERDARGGGTSPTAGVREEPDSSVSVLVLDVMCVLTGILRSSTATTPLWGRERPWRAAAA